MIKQKELSRRNFIRNTLAGVGAGIGASVIPSLAEARVMDMPDMSTYNISFRNQHTGESFSGVYRTNGRYLPDAFEKINYILRDFRTGDVFPIDPRTIDILFMIRHKLNQNDYPYEILSGYRSPKTNAMLSRISTGVATNSLHMTGKAIDIRLPGYKTSAVRRAAISLKAGGVGYYPKSNFVHVDTGRPRNW